jgi:hypothetical protein
MISVTLFLTKNLNSVFFLLYQSFSDTLFFSRNLLAFLLAGYVQFPETLSGFWLTIFTTPF